MAVHGGSHENYGFDHMNVYAPVHALGHPFGQMIGFAGLIFNGVMDKFPNVKWGFLEGGISWFMLCLERFDRSYETHIHSDPREELIQLRAGERISDYIKRNIDEDRIYVGCEGNEPFIPAAVRAAGDKFLFFSSDFPHEVNNEMCKHELQEVLEQEGIDDAAKAGIRHANSETFYRLNGK
jgi:predicted TIM-barrel fold metal-dependent hydrolase